MRVCLSQDTPSKLLNAYNKMEDFKNNFDKIKERLIESIPYMGNLKGKDWNKIEREYAKRLDCLQEGILVPKSLIDFVIASIHPKQDEIAQHYKQWICALNDMIDEAIGFSSKSQILTKQINKKITDLLTDIESIDTPNSDFKNILNELQVFNYLSECENIEVEQIEMKIESGKKIDYVVKVKSDKKRIGIEIMTMQGIRADKQDDDNSMNKFIIERIEKKYKDKVRDLTEIKELDNLLIFPIIEDQDGLEQFSLDISCEVSYPPHVPALKKGESGKCHFCLIPAKDYTTSKKDNEILSYMPA